MNTDKGHILNNIKKTQWVFSVILILIILPWQLFSQNPNGKNQIILFGQVTTLSNGAPMRNQEIQVSSDSINEPNFVYSTKLTTDVEGYFYDTITTSELKGHFIISTQDFENISYDTSVYFRFNWSENNVLEANFSIPNEIGSPIYQANFKCKANPSGENNLEYQFTDITNSSNIISWEWDLGDGITSSEQNPLHTYSEGGIYRIKLNTVKYSPQGQTTYHSSMVKVIHVTVKGYYNIGGHIMAGYFPIDHGAAYLYKIEEGDYISIDTAFFNDSLGYYYFPQLIEGKYIVKADLTPNSILFNQYLATYYSNKEYWEEADTIFNLTNNYEYDIQLISNNQQMSGPGQITGTINYTTNVGGNKIFGADNVVIMLLDEDHNPMDICHSDNEGNFILDNLDLNNYQLYAEVTGKTTYPVSVELNEANSTINSVNIIIGNYNVNGSVNSGINTTYLENVVGNVYPNPVADIFWIDIDATGHSLNYDVFNRLGEHVISGTTEMNAVQTRLNVDASEIPSGVYFISLTDENKLQTTRKFVKK